MDNIPEITLEKLNELEAQTEDKFIKSLIESLKKKITLPKRNEFYETLDFERILTLVEKEKNRRSLKEAEKSIKEEKLFVLKVSRVNYGKKTKTIEVKGDAPLSSLSGDIQDAFDLEPMHLYEFEIGKYKFGPECDEWEEIFDILDNYRLDAAISFAGLNQGDKIGFLYDFGDNIRFKIEILDIRNAGNKNEQ
ncbi:hypothetical protein A3K73_05100 [Candidatus Pacearchaeota archaeon RBG_13_36_9]|nr:MAG: hypothetical protein A3K73_05100 [Candidatus Pacearchaeota archaeon RBG_13_36_9]